MGLDIYVQQSFNRWLAHNLVSRGCRSDGAHVGTRTPRPTDHFRSCRGARKHSSPMIHTPTPEQASTCYQLTCYSSHYILGKGFYKSCIHLFSSQGPAWTFPMIQQAFARAFLYNFSLNPLHRIFLLYLSHKISRNQSLYLSKINLLHCTIFSMNKPKCE